MNINTEVKRMKKTIDELNDVSHDATREFVSKYCDVEKYDAFMSRTSPLLETGILIAIVGIGYNNDDLGLDGNNCEIKVIQEKRNLRRNPIP
mgnify:CR=1 FL=1